MENVNINDFSKLEFRVGLIKLVEEIENSSKLFKLKVDFGDEERQVVSGIKKWYSIDEILQKKFIFITNLENRKIMGIESQAMIMAAEEDGNVVLIQPEKNIKEGSKIR